MLMTFEVHHALVTAGDNRAVEIVHDAADGIGNMPVGIVLIAQHHLFAHGIAFGPIAFSKLLAHHHLVGGFEHFMLVASQQLVIEEFKEVRCNHQDIGIYLHATDIKYGIITRYRAPGLYFRKAVLQLLTYAEVRHGELFVTNHKGTVATGLVVLYRCLTIDEVAQQQQEGHRQAQAHNINNGKQAMATQELKIAFHNALLNH